MKTLQITSLLAAVALSAACHHKRPLTHERVASIDKDTRDGAREMEKDIERDTKEAAAGATKAGDDLDAALEGKHDVVGSAADDANAAANDAAKDVDAAADKAAVDTKKEVGADAKTATTAADRANTDANAAAKQTEPKKVVAEIETIDRHSKQVTFRIRDEEKDIQLQAGREMKIDFAELPVLTGMKIDAAIAKMHEGQDVDLKVLGTGENAKVVKLTLGDF